MLMFLFNKNTRNNVFCRNTVIVQFTMSGHQGEENEELQTDLLYGVAGITSMKYIQRSYQAPM